MIDPVQPLSVLQFFFQISFFHPRPGAVVISYIIIIIITIIISLFSIDVKIYILLYQKN